MRPNATITVAIYNNYYLVHVNTIEPGERWCRTLWGGTEIVDGDARMQIGHTKHGLAWAEGLCTQHRDVVVNGFPVADDLKCVDVDCHYVTLRHTYTKLNNNYYHFKAIIQDNLH